MGQNEFWREMKKQLPGKHSANPPSVKNKLGTASKNAHEFEKFVRDYYQGLGTLRPESSEFDIEYCKKAIQVAKKRASEKIPGSESLDRDWTIKELLSALSEAKNGAPGPDKIGNKVLKAVFGREEDAQALLELINIVWREGSVPKKWKHTIKKPFHKREH